jgi:spermidine synthase
VAIYRSVEDWGYHLLASETPIPEITPEEFAARLPEAAKRDLIEWGPNQSLIAMTKDVLSPRVPIGTVLQADLPAEITDDQPYNEYFILRRRAPFALRLFGMQG